MLQSDGEARRREKILDWISTSESESKHNAIRMPRVAGTGEWLVNTDEFMTWRMGVDYPSLLWCTYRRSLCLLLRVETCNSRHVLGVFGLDT